MQSHWRLYATSPASEFIRFLKKIDSETPAELNLHLIVIIHPQT